jgi:hypothetical protein
MPKKTTRPEEASSERKEMLERFIRKYNRFFQKVLLAMLSGLVPRRHIPDLVFTTESDCYTDHSKIVLGLNQKEYTTDSTLYGFVYYVLGHEVQHILSTTQKPWMYGINTSIRHVIAYFQKLHGYPVTTLVGEDNLRAAIAKMRKDGKLVPTYDQIGQFCHYICNAVEDGRIERHRTGMYPGYGRYVRYFRGQCWLTNIELPPEGAVLTPGERLSLYCSEVLSLSTCHVYGRDFWKHYAGTPEAKVVDEIRRHVTRAVYARKCKQCMKECIDIIDIITPTFAESHISNPENMFMQMLMELLNQIMNAHGAEGFSELRESKEQDATGNGKNPLGASILGTPETDAKGDVTGEIGEEGDGQESGESAAQMPPSSGKATEGGKKGTEHSGSHQAGEAGSATFDADELQREMQEAAARINSDFSASAGNMCDATAQSKRADVSIQESDASSIAQRKNIDFTEVQRMYTVDIPLPFVIEERARVLREKVKRVFQPKKTGAYKNKTTGRVSPEKLFTLAINEGNCFEVKKKPQKFSGCCYVLQDNSGSMGSGRNSKRMFASEATACIEYAFKDFVPLKITAFDEGGKVVHEVIKNWKDNFNYSCSYNFFHKGRSGCCNADYHSIAIATEELLARNEKDKILIVISDGLPCSSKGMSGNPQSAVRNAVEYARSRGIKVVGIYIDDVVKDADRKAYEFMYGSSCVFTDTDHIADELAKVMTTWAHV